MVRALSEDLRVRVIKAVAAGSSRREAAARFGVSVSSAIRWVAVWQATGRTAATPTGGDLRSARIEAHRDFLLAAGGTALQARNPKHRPFCATVISCVPSAGAR